jgi:hypothetical protein
MEGIIMNTAAQSPGQSPSAGADPLLAEAMAATLSDYKDALDETPAEPVTEADRAQLEQMGAAARSDARIAPLIERRPEFIAWAARKAAADSTRDAAEISVDDAQAVLDDPRRRLVRNLLDAALEKYPRSSVGYLRRPLEAVLDDPRPWAGSVGQFTRAAVDDLRVAQQLGVDVIKTAEDHQLAPFDVLAALNRARLRVSDDPAWYAEPEPAARGDMLRHAYEAELAAGEGAPAEQEQARRAEAGQATAGEPGPAPVTTPSGDPCAYPVSAIPLDEPPLPTRMVWARMTDPCQSMDYLRNLVRTYAIGENGQLFLAAERLSDRWAEATNWCWPDRPAAHEAQGMVCCQSLDDAVYRLRRQSEQTDTVYAMRSDLYQAQLENPGFRQAWDDFVAQVADYLASPGTGKRRDASYRCIGIYTAAETLRRTAAAQMTGLARMQIKELACSLQTVWRLFTNPRVIQVIDPAAAGGRWDTDSSVTNNCQADKQAAVVFAVAQQLLGPDASGLYQAWDKAIRLDRVFHWIQCGKPWKPGSRCEKNKDFVVLLGAMSALLPGSGWTAPGPMSSLMPTSQSA